jgi:hypothetical protein
MDDQRLGRVEDRLDELATTKLAGRQRQEEWRRVASILGLRAVIFHRGFRACVNVPASAAAHTLLRCMADLAILIDWIDLDPVRHLDLWEADGWQETAKGIKEALDTGVVERIGLNRSESEAAYAAKEKAIDDVRRRYALGPKAPLVPDTASMARKLGADIQGQLYTVIIRIGSGYVHSSAGSFAETMAVGNVEGPLRDPAGARRTAASLLAYILAAVSRIDSLQMEDECDQLRHELVGGHDSASH